MREKHVMPDNTLMVITPYWHNGTWVFDDPTVGLVREPFVSGVPEVIDLLVKDVPNARAGVRITFSGRPFPGFMMKLTFVREEFDGAWYRLAEPAMEGWLCSALFKYFDEAPRELYIRADELPK
jgi:hypothetical protein